MSSAAKLPEPAVADDDEHLSALPGTDTVEETDVAEETSNPVLALFGEHLSWRPTTALAIALTFCGALLALAVMLRRGDFVLLAAPMLIGTVFALLRRPYGLPEVRLRVSGESMLENQLTDAVVQVSSAEPLDLVCVQLDSSEWLRAQHGRPERVTTAAAGAPGAAVVRLRSLRWGRQSVGPAIVEAVGAHGLLRRGPMTTSTLHITTLPLREGFEATDAVPRAAGMVGLHRSRRPGDGTDIAGVRPFVPGDKLRRINWPVSLRARELHVTATMSDRDTDVILVLDTHFDLGVSEGVDGASSSLDTTVRAAASIAEHYLRHGDRVGLVDIGQSDRRVRAAAGRAHLTRILDVLLDVTPGTASGGITAAMALAALPPGALVMMLSPLVGDAAIGRAASIARTGHTLLVVDTLPADARPPRRSEWTDIAYQVWQLERGADTAHLAELGVPVVPWRGAGSLDDVLRDLARAATAPKALR